MSMTRLLLGPNDQGRRLSVDEFREAEETQGYRYELARGVVEVTEVPNDPHGQIVSNLYDAIAGYKRLHPRRIRRYGGGSEFRLWVPEMESGRNPDLSIVLEGAAKDQRGRFRPALVVEVVSLGGEERDYVTKREEFLVYGVDEYWVVDPSSLKVLVLCVEEVDGVTRWSESVFGGDETIVSRRLPGLACRVSDLWLDAEL